MKRALIITAGLCMCGLSAPSYALGPKHENAILGQSSMTIIDLEMKENLVQNNYVETRLPQTFSVKSKFRVNGHEIYDSGGEQTTVSGDIKTAGKVALGAVLLALAAIVLFFGAFFIAYEPED